MKEERLWVMLCKERFGTETVKLIEALEHIKE